jgi:hypothetical protein
MSNVLHIVKLDSGFNCAATIEELQELTQSEKTTAWNLYGDWKMENLLGIAPKCTGLAKLAIDYVISKRKKIA